MQGPSEIRVVSSLALLYVFRMLGLFMVFPIMMLYGREYEGSTTLLLGVALGLYGVTQAIFQIPMGLLSDIWGRKNIIFLGLVLFAAGSLVAALSETMLGLLLGRLLQGAGAIAAAILALVGDLTSEKSRTRAMAIIGASIGLSFAIALFLGPVLASSGGLSLVFWVSFGLAVAGIAILVFVVPSPPAKDPETDKPAVMSLLKDSIVNIDLLRLNLAIFSLHFVLTATFVMAPLLLEASGLPGESHWTYYLPIMLAAFIGMLPFMFIAERKHKTKLLMILAILCLAASEIVLGSVGEQKLGWISALLAFFIAFNLLEATLPSLMSKLAPAKSKGTAMGLYSTCQFMGAAIGGVVGGYTLEYYGFFGVVIACLVVCTGWLISTFYIRFPHPVEKA